VLGIQPSQLTGARVACGLEADDWYGQQTAQDGCSGGGGLEGARRWSKMDQWDWTRHTFATGWQGGKLVVRGQPIHRQWSGDSPCSIDQHGWKCSSREVVLVGAEGRCGLEAVEWEHEYGEC
jgi:hypothetical protein